MGHIKFAAAFAGLTLALSLGVSSAQAQLARTAEVKDIPLRGGVHMFMGAGGNLAVLPGDDGVVIVDTQFAEMVDRLTAAVKAISPQPIKYALNTHWHFDHTGGNEGFGKAGVRIIAHENTFKRMSTAQVMPAMNMKFDPSPAAALPVLTFTDTSALRVNGMTTQMVHLPAAHTDTDAMIVFKEANVIHTGDVYTRMTYPFVDTASGGTLTGMIKARKTILAASNADTQIIPGHGALSTPEELKASIAMLEDMEKRTIAALKAGQTLEQFVASNPTADFDATYAPRPDQGKVFATRAYEDLARFVKK
ncbi:MAG: MBL fold metallo-hydrolase [Rhodospirillaceae bacterium]|nr:MBL fold metallo-hydrolase [Rhodospirillaceae bacterium]